MSNLILEDSHEALAYHHNVGEAQQTSPRGSPEPTQTGVQGVKNPACGSGLPKGAHSPDCDQFCDFTHTPLDPSVPLFPHT